MCEMMKGDAVKSEGRRSDDSFRTADVSKRK
jgi:hypothetical protein